jgi:hypothetical protein
MMIVVVIDTKKRPEICSMCLDGTGILYEFQGKVDSVKFCVPCLTEVRGYVPRPTNVNKYAKHR